ncbi:type III polyketide synthase [Cellulomonas timonensis]|uniref:type III polyketide synthase n=1 Tax=Cellulomonas timonensis TaxID=1689271 RepID=UPI00082A95A7|nr:3-oxoacyl-[acyl-carrier-protein] synthase III C-terminal domain-containing protein [Cellulomonas timonensis]
MSRIVAVAPVLPEHAYPQAAVAAHIAPLLSPDPVRQAVITRLSAASGVDTRHFALPLEEYAGLRSFGQANDLFITLGLDLAEEAVRQALKAAALGPDDIDLIMFTSITGISAPSLDALLVGRVGLRPDVKRIPVFGLGCVAGAAGLARLHDHLLGHPSDVALLVSVELCSLTLQRDDGTLANAVSCALFGDGATAVVVAGDERAVSATLPGPTIQATRSWLFPGTEDVLGWDVVDTGFRIVLAPTLPRLVETALGPAVESFLGSQGLAVTDVAAWLAHSGGPRILDAVARSIGLPPDALDLSRRALARTGNLSSSGVLHVLADALAGADHPPPPRGSPVVLLALGPGVSTELLLLRWEALT